MIYLLRKFKTIFTIFILTVLLGTGFYTASAATVEFANPLQAQDFKQLIDALLDWIFWLSIPIAIIMIMYAGFLMLSAGDNSQKFEHGKKVLFWVVIGLAIIFIGEGFITLIESILALK